MNVQPARWSTDDDEGNLLVQSWWNEQAGGYRVRVSLGGSGLAWELDDQRALRYAKAVLHVAGAAIHDAAVASQLEAHGVDPDGAGALIAAELRPPRRYDDQATAPLRLRPDLGIRPDLAIGRPGRVGIGPEGPLRPLVRMEVPPTAGLDYRAALIEAAAAAGHGVAVLEVAAAVQFDSAYQAALVKLGASPLRARALVDDLPRFRIDAGGDAAGGGRRVNLPDARLGRGE
jgi:hypothetical protein